MNCRHAEPGISIFGLMKSGLLQSHETGFLIFYALNKAIRSLYLIPNQLTVRQPYYLICRGAINVLLGYALLVKYV